MKQQTQYSKKVKSRRRGRFIPLLFIVLFVAALTYYFYRDTLYAYWEPQEPPVTNTDTKPPNEEIPTTKDPTPNEEVPPKVEEPSLYPPAEGEILQVKDGNYLLALVTKQTSLGEYKPSDIVPVSKEMWFNDYPYELRKETYQQARKMWEDAQVVGINFLMNSAYRSYSVQRDLYNKYVARSGEVAASKFSAKPGHSEHQLGTAIDFSIPGYYLSEKFAETAEGKWLAENAYKYGFAMSYPPDSTHITGYIYEPWHFRYIGVENAAAWKASGMVLMQWLEQQPQHWKE